MSPLSLEGLLEKSRLVYCTRCGTLNPDSAQTCSNCGASLVTEPASPRYEGREHSRGAGIGLLIAGLFIVLIGVTAIVEVNIWNFIWPLILIFIGIWLLSLGLKRNRRYTHSKE